jgi:hypothetical protein
MLGFPVLGSGLDDFVRHVLPVLAARGHHDVEQCGATLRDYFGLSYRESCYARRARVSN